MALLATDRRRGPAYKRDTVLERDRERDSLRERQSEKETEKETERDRECATRGVRQARASAHMSLSAPAFSGITDI